MDFMKKKKIIKAMDEGIRMMLVIFKKEVDQTFQITFIQRHNGIINIF